MNKTNLNLSYTKINLKYENAMATSCIGIGVKKEGDLVISGTKGYIYVPAPWWKTEYFEIRFEDLSKIQKYFSKFDGDGLRYELSDFINAINQLTDKNTLIMYSLAVEKFSLEKKDAYILNRLNSYASKLDNFFLKNYILLISENYPEINQIEILNSLSSNYGFDSKGSPKYENIKVLDNLINASVEALRNFAKACEDYYREINKVSYLGDITDYSESLSKIDLLHYLIYMIGKDSTLDDLNLLATFQKGKDLDVPTLEEKLHNLPLTKLRDITIVLLKYHRECLKQAYFEGISELVTPLNENELISEIVKVIQEHYELRNDEGINALLLKYGYPGLED